MSRLLRAGVTKKSCLPIFYRTLCGRSEAVHVLQSDLTNTQPVAFTSWRSAHGQQIVPCRGVSRSSFPVTGFEAGAYHYNLHNMKLRSLFRTPHATYALQPGSAKESTSPALPLAGFKRAMSSDSGRDRPASYSTTASPSLEPQLYVAANTFQKRDNLLVLDLLNTAFRRPPSEEQQFLDIGCAVGDFTRDVLLPRSSPCWRIVGTDVSRTMIEYAERYYGHPRITYDVLDVARDVGPFVECYGRFDRVYSFFCLHWIRDQIGALRNVHHLMKPEGECLLQFCARTPVYQLWRDFAAMDRWKNHIANVEDFIPPSQDADDRLAYLEQVLSAAELKPHTCEVLRNVWTFPSEQHLAASISAVLHVADGVPDYEKEELARAMSAEMLRRCSKGPAGFSAEFDIYVVHASRFADSEHKPVHTEESRSQALSQQVRF